MIFLVLASRILCTVKDMCKGRRKTVLQKLEKKLLQKSCTPKELKPILLSALRRGFRRGRRGQPKPSAPGMGPNRPTTESVFDFLRETNQTKVFHSVVCIFFFINECFMFSSNLTFFCVSVFFCASFSLQNSSRGYTFRFGGWGVGRHSNAPRLGAVKEWAKSNKEWAKSPTNLSSPTKWQMDAPLPRAEGPSWGRNRNTNSLTKAPQCAHEFITLCIRPFSTACPLIEMFCLEKQGW